ncbi:MAG TPA: JAB domain-containing protein [Ohtaekwangia sp.]|uniref:JAB domain-containing protein n=1 Tax=Ohtaekwangia sp. TaxID=2066019 RepID=UPI002F937ED1
MTIKLSDEQRIKILNSDDLYAVMQNILLREEKIDQEKEHFWMIGLATNNRILYVELVSLGSVNGITIEPMNVFRVAVLKGAVKAIIAHNHPSGELKPSDADKDLTDRLIQVGRILNIPIIDHLIISTNSYMSFADTGLLEQLERSIRWVPAFELVDRIKKEEKKIREQMIVEEKEKAVKKIVKNAIKEGLPISVIEKLTGLTKEEIAKLR